MTAPPDYEYIPGFYGISIERTGEVSVAGRVPLTDRVAAPDASMRTAAVLMGIDMACGMAAGLGVLPKWTVTADAEVHLVAPCRVGPLRVDAECVRAGRTMSVVDARIVDEGADDALVAVATANHGVLESSFDHFLERAAPGDVHEFARPARPDDETPEDYFGVRDEAGAVRAELDLRTTNPWGIFHGGLTGLLVDRAARRAGIGTVTDVGLRFLNAVRTGPAEARVVADSARPDDRVLRVELRDGPGGRLAVLGHVVGH